MLDKNPFKTPFVKVNFRTFFFFYSQEISWGDF